MNIGPRPLPAASVHPTRSSAPTTPARGRATLASTTLEPSTEVAFTLNRDSRRSGRTATSAAPTAG